MSSCTVACPAACIAADAGLASVSSSSASAQSLQLSVLFLRRLVRRIVSVFPSVSWTITCRRVESRAVLLRCDWSIAIVSRMPCDEAMHFDPRRPAVQEESIVCLYSFPANEIHKQYHHYWKASICGDYTIL